MNSTKERSSELVQRLTRYVDDLIEAKKNNNKLAIKGRTQMILNVLDKLRDIHKHNPIPTDLINKIIEDKNRAELKLPKTFSNYTNFCWDCLKRGKQVGVDKRVDSVCPSCGWVQCPDCGACRSPRFGGCKKRKFFNSKK